MLFKLIIATWKQNLEGVIRMSLLYVLGLDSSQISLNFYIFFNGMKKNVAVRPSMWASLSNTRQQPEQQEIA